MVIMKKVLEDILRDWGWQDDEILQSSDGNVYAIKTEYGVGSIPDYELTFECHEGPRAFRIFVKYPRSLSDSRRDVAAVVIAAINADANGGALQLFDDEICFSQTVHLELCNPQIQIATNMRLLVSAIFTEETVGALDRVINSDLSAREIVQTYNIEHEKNVAAFWAEQ